MRANTYYLNIIYALLSVRVRNICPGINLPDAPNGLVFYRGPETGDMELEKKIRHALFEKMSRLEATSTYKDYSLIRRTVRTIVSSGQNVPKNVSGSKR